MPRCRQGVGARARYLYIFFVHDLRKPAPSAHRALAGLGAPPERLLASHPACSLVRSGGPPRSGQEGFEILEAVADAAAELDEGWAAPAAPPGLQALDLDLEEFCHLLLG